MRTDRLLAEVLHLLKHQRTTARQLAARFEVSPRTILRDMDALCMAGVPVISTGGANGGFCLAEGYRIDACTENRADAELLSTALQALSTVIKDEALRAAMERYCAPARGKQTLHIDLAALAEDERTQQNLAALRVAIQNRHAVRILYTNAVGECAEHTVEPMELHYRWYAWYLHAYSRQKLAVLTYKLLRMDRVTETDEPIAEHADAAPLPDERPIMRLTLRCKEKARVPLIEYLHAIPQEKLDNGDWLMHAVIPAGERFWRGALLSLGADVEILSPPEVIEEFRQLARDISQLYKEN